MLEKLLGEYLPATLTFLVGLLGILSQLTINFFSERAKHKLEISKIKIKNINECYLPLLALVRKYQYYQQILSVNKSFTLQNYNYPNDSEFKAQYEVFKEIYSSIELLLKSNYVPIESELNRQIQNFSKHVILINCLWQGQSEGEIFKVMVPDNEQYGYDVEPLISKLDAVIVK